MLRTRLQGFAAPFLLCSLLLIVPTFLYLTFTSPKSPVNDAHTAVSLNKLYEVGDEVAGGVIMPKLPNATAKAELGRASWKLLHTMAQRYPEQPTADEKSAFRSYIYLFSRLYPCGECAAHFQKLLKDYPPQTSSRKSAAMWLCAVHNQVNERLGKEEFDCANLDGLYDCGCGDESQKPVAGALPASEGDFLTDHEKAEEQSAIRSHDPLTGEDMIPGRAK